MSKTTQGQSTPDQKGEWGDIPINRCCDLTSHNGSQVNKRDCKRTLLKGYEEFAVPVDYLTYYLRSRERLGQRGVTFEGGGEPGSFGPFIVATRDQSGKRGKVSDLDECRMQVRGCLFCSHHGGPGAIGTAICLPGGRLKSAKEEIVRSGYLPEECAWHPPEQEVNGCMEGRGYVLRDSCWVKESAH